eukprot:5953244-Pyramimonas_sp.AAC.1
MRAEARPEDLPAHAPQRMRAEAQACRSARAGPCGCAPKRGPAELRAHAPPRTRAEARPKISRAGAQMVSRRSAR